ncbi:hypothetical protein RSA37_13045 [Mammaliicoccus sciuri]|uniref:hypothetical protein n=1 Tax=Mammaliicoccus sciuri TaxID=1296 RepID=UPI000733FF4B|nr:hypothetical protein [Mammaliicoccus sciuri]KTT84865.1 hypothetical protein NS1R_08135 [Mammaliicoccus sciuri]KTT89555.1 hypothetical protein NS112_05240 [Mammaliicoccus sciuri]KTT90659.1 hypothetical protein NS36R_05360 [Mammaliicoccus sciuri]KTT92499.1 hypothetical protein NS44R_14365 [Mammaliicoccus sciuri]KTW10404.1 hypothetical protein RSA37_13045 [Mammaliicoccus sciuri]
MNVSKKIFLTSLSTVMLSMIIFTSDLPFIKSSSNSSNVAEAKLRPGISYKYYSATYSVKRLKNPKDRVDKKVSAAVKKKYGKYRKVRVKMRVTMDIRLSTQNAIAYKVVKITPL